MKYASVFLIGFLFGVGLIVSGMTQPQKVISFLDVFGTWDPSLAYVMGSALLVAHLGFRYVLDLPSPVYDNHFRLPRKTVIDLRLVTGAGFFGIGWGLSGFCPGPVLASIGSGQSSVLIFVASMFLGFFLNDLLDLKKSHPLKNSSLPN